jgi:signal transduction histidine kinase
MRAGLAVRVAAAIAIACIAASLALFLFAEQTQREAVANRVADLVRTRMENGGRERCEAAPARFESAWSERRASEGRRARRRERPAQGAITVHAIDGTSSTGGAPLDPSVVRALEDDDVTLAPGRGRRERVIVRMPWDEGPCAIVAVEVPRPEAPIRLRALGLAAIVAVVAALAAFLSLRSPLSRLRALTQAAERLARAGFAAPGDTPLALPAAGKDEIGELTRAFRAAVDRIAEDATRLSARDAALSEYVAHTTHDLATPLTAITAHLAELEQDLERGRPIDRRTVERATTEAHYLAQLVANLGVVARLDRPDPIVQKRSIDLRDVVERVAARHAPLARAAGLSLDHAVPDAPVTIDGDDLLLERALGNLVHNAIRHRKGGPDGHVAIVLANDARGVRLRVLDDGTPPSAEVLARLREPTVDAARTRGHGFGLDVVRRVAALHGLTLSFAPAESGGLEVTLVS